MSELFLAVINMSISASWIVLAVFVLRLLLKKAPKWIAVLLWAVVALRLICPFTVESALSLIPSAQTVSPGIMTDTYPQIHTGIPVFNNSVNPIIGETFSPNPGDSINPLQVWIPVMSMIWMVGMGALGLYGIISYFRLKRKVGTAVLLRDRVYQSERVASPFVLGVFRPKIYLPFAMEESDIPHVLSHEEAHISRKDHWWKPLGFAILALHWFNPLMWLSYALLCRDIELACDEKVVRNLDIEGRADYSQALLHCAVGRPMILACPVAFGEVGVKDRIKSVLSYKKPAFWVLLLGIIASIVLAICFLTNPTPGTLGTLENLEFNSLSEEVENTGHVWVSDGISYHRVGAISEDLLRDLVELKTSKEEVSLDRSEDRDKSHTIILRSKSQARISPNYYIGGINIHFNSDFTFVWIDDGIKPTLSYRIIEPKKAEEVYNSITEYNVKESGKTIRTIHGNFRSYQELSDGTWYYDGYTYEHRLVITGRMPNAVADTTYVYLSNLESISFERAMWASGLSSSLEQYFSPEEAVLVEIKTGEPTLEEISISRNQGAFTYTIVVKDAAGATLCEENNASREPEILRTGLDIYGLRTHTGTGRSTNYAVFYDLKQGRVSETFYYVLTALREYVVRVEPTEEGTFVVVENIFDPALYCETYELPDPAPKVGEIVTSWSYAGTDNNGVSVTYLSGENYTETEFFIDIP